MSSGPKLYGRTVNPTGAKVETTQRLDISSLMKANQILSQTVNTSGLLKEMIKILVENAGAEKAIVLQQDEDAWFIEARGDPGVQAVQTGMHLQLSADLLSMSVFRYVVNSAKVVVLANASEDPQFGGDPYLRHNGVKSVLCLPVLHEGALKLVLYLENNLMVGAFTEDRLGLLQLLSGQMAISFKNALMLDILKTTIAERKQAEETVRESEERLRLVIEGTSDGIWDWNAVAEKVYYSPRYYTMLGYEPGEFPPTVASWRKLLHPDDENATLQALRQALKKQGSFSAEYRIKAKNGEWRWLQSRGKAVEWDADGNVTRMAGSQTDISERKKAEEALRENEERLRLVLDGTSDGIWDWSHKTGRVYFGPRYYAMLGYEPDEFPPGYKSWTQLLHPDDAKVAKKALRQALEHGRPFSVEFRLRKKDGEWLWILGRGKAVEWDAQGNVTRMVGSHTDISERRKTEEKLRESAEQYRMITGTSMDGFVMSNEVGRILDVNEAYCQMVGYSRDELITMSFSDVEEQESSEEIQEHIRLVKMFGFDRFESRHRKKNGDIIDVEVSVTFSPSNRHLSFFRDVTARKRADEALRQAILVVESSPAVLFRWRNEKGWPVEFVSRNVTQFGYAVEELLSENVSFASMVHPEDAERVGREVQEYTDSGFVQFRQEYRLLTKDGNVRWVDDRTVVERDSQGRAVSFQGIVLDITERKKAEEALRESAERFRMMTSSSMDGIMINDQAGRILDVNDSYCQILGYSRDELLRMSVSDIEAVESPEEIQKHIQRVRGAGSDRFETRHRRKDGSIIDTEVSLTHLRHTSHQLCFLRDVTERKRADEELRKAIMVLENSPAVLFRWKAVKGFPVEFVSKNVIQFGYSHEELISGKIPFTSMVHPDDAKWLGREVRACDKRGDLHFQMVYRLVTRDGKSRWVDDRTMIARDAHGRATYHQGIILDITEHKLAEEALEKRVVALTQPLDSPENIAFEHLFNLSDMQHLQDLLAKAFGVAALITDPDGTAITQPSNFTEFCREFIRNNPRGVKNCIRSDALVATPNPTGPTIRQCLSVGLCNAGAAITIGGRHVANFMIGQVRNETQDEEKIMEYGRQIGEDEEPFRAAYRKVPVMPQKQFERAAHVLFAITTQLSTSAYQNVQQARFIADRRRAEVELSRYRDHLEELVRDRTKELEAAQEQLVKRERLSVLGQLTATVSHELRNPLGVIRSSTFYLQERIKDGDQKIQKHLDRIETQVDICDEIVGELLEYTRGSSSEMKTGEITPCLEKQLEEARGTEAIQLTSVFSNDLPEIFFDAGKMGRVITNLLDNAVHAVRDMTRKAEEEKTEYEPKIRVKTARAEGGVVIQVEDNGIGMDEGTVRRASEPLFTTKARGTGLGLSIVKKIVEEHGGTLSLESELHGGTKVTLWMPVRERRS